MDDPESEYVDLIIELGKLEKTKQWNIVESYARAIIQRFPTSIYALKRLGIALVKQGKFNEAIIFYEEAVETGKRFGAGHLEYVKQLDVLYRQLGRYEDAFRICSYYLSQDKHSKDAINRFNRSAKLVGRGELAKPADLVITPTNKRVPLGKDTLPPITSDIPAPTQAEEDLIIVNWNTYAPPEYRGMLEARPIGTDDPKALWFYDPARRRYISRSGHEVSPDELNRAYLAYKKAKDLKE